jgi:2-dehydropantoate 2-reductase
MKLAVVGAGAIGAYVGAALARGGSDVILIARGPHLQALREHGVRVLSERGDFVAHPAAVERIRDAGPVDAVILALKAHQLDGVLVELPALFYDRTMVVGMQNGLPWWYFQRHGGPYDGMVLESVDPGGRISAAIDPSRVIGCVVYAATEIAAPGVIRHVEGTRFSLGEPNRSASERSRELAAAFVAGGLKAPVEREIRAEIWLKLLGNAAFNPISALTRATLVEMTDDALVEPLVHEMMQECVAVASALGVTLDISIERRIDGARRVGAHKTSMLQDLEARKPLETEALVGSVVELGAKLDISMPATRHVYALTKLLERAVLAGR